MGRIGITTNISACMGDVGYKGKWLLQLSSVAQRIRIYSDTALAQLYYFEITGDIENYNGHYQNGIGDDKTSLIFSNGDSVKN